jgi:photosystem II stability/assembly factor-like uncharacterized protein
MKLLRLVATLATAVALAPAAWAGAFVDVLDTPAQATPLAAKSLLQAVVRAGESLVAVGARGHIVVSRDDGATWRQAKVPVSSDLTAVHFIDARQGWAVGHDGVVLHSADGGATWSLQLDGRKANEILVAAMKRRSDAEPSSEEAKKLLAEATRYLEQGPDKPFLDVWFDDADNGWVVGAYNLIFRTGDGGKSWTPWFDRTDNPKFFNLHAIRPVAGQLYVAGESGLLLKLDAAAQRFVALKVPYTGSFFGLAEAKGSVLAFGLRGNVLRSDDAGRTWAKVEAGLSAPVVAATHTSSDATLLADFAGRVVASEDGGRSFTPVTLKPPMPVTGLAEAGGGRLAIAGPRGVAIADVAR